MSVKRIISDEKKAKIVGSKVHKGKTVSTMSDVDKDDLIQIIAEKLGLI